MSCLYGKSIKTLKALPSMESYSNNGPECIDCSSFYKNQVIFILTKKCKPSKRLYNKKPTKIQSEQKISNHNKGFIWVHNVEKPPGVLHVSTRSQQDKNFH